MAVYPAITHAVRDPSRDCPELVPMEEASALLLSVRLRPRDNSQLLNPMISWDQFFAAFKAFERIWVTRETFRDSLVDSAAIAGNPAHRGILIPRIRINNCVTLLSHFSFDLAQIFASVPTR